ncbi:IS3 family transposase [Pseudomonas sp. ISL-84]|nr:IS3 family transposase [Pseudomonas sp. ISL-84]
MGTRVHYPEEIKWEAIKLKQKGLSNQAIMDQLGIKNVSQIKTWMKWHREGQVHRFSQPVGKQYTYGKGPGQLSEVDELRRKIKQLEIQLKILKKVPRDRKELEPQIALKVVEELSSMYSIISILATLEVPKATYYRWKKKYSHTIMSPLEELIVHLCEENHFRYGHRKIKALLKRNHQVDANRKTVQKIMQKYKVQCQIKVKRPKYLNGETNIIVENLLNRQFRADKPNEKWVTDITYLPYGPSMVYLSTIMDLYNNEIVAYKISTSQETHLVLDTLREALEKRKPAEGIMIHTDQGAVYTSYAFQNMAKENGMITSMSRKGNCHDNAVIESFHSSLKSEGLKDQKRSSLSHCKLVDIVNQYMYYYNEIRIQAKLNYLSPIEYRGQAA